MTNQARSPLANHRARKASQGFVRVEVNVPKEDAGLLRTVAAALRNPLHHQTARLLLQQDFAEPVQVSLKDLLASAPLDGIELERPRESGRTIEL